VHNTYFTLPVLVSMLSNHYGWLYQGPHNWLVLVLLMLAGALIRHSFVARHKALCMGRRAPWEHAVVGTVMLLGLAIWLAPAPHRRLPKLPPASRHASPRCRPWWTSAACCATTPRCSRRTWPCTRPR
jgi:uncharacterized membrane protein